MPGPVSTGKGDCVGAGKLSRSNQSPRSTQPGHLSVGRHNEYRPNGGTALQLQVWLVFGGRKNCDVPL